MSVTKQRAEDNVKAAWTAFCKAVVAYQEVHGRPVTCYFGEGQVVADQALLEAYHEGYGAKSQDGVTLIELPAVPGFHQDGGGW